MVGQTAGLPQRASRRAKADGKKTTPGNDLTRFLKETDGRSNGRASPEGEPESEGRWEDGYAGK